MNKLFTFLCGASAFCAIAFSVTACAPMQDDNTGDNGNTPNPPTPSYTVAESLENFTALLQEGKTEIGIGAEIPLAAAVEAIPVGDNQITLVLLADMTAGGVTVAEDKDIVLDFNNHTYTVSSETVGSAGTESNGLWLHKTASVTLKNGTLKNASDDTGAKILIQNYSDLTLDNFTVDATDSASGYGLYAVSNNFGTLTLKNGTNILAKEGEVAFDLWYGMSEVYDAGVEITAEETAGKIQGKVEYGAASRVTEAGWEAKAKITVKGGEFNGTLVATSGNDLANANISVSGGKFTVDPTPYLAQGHTVKQENGYFVVSK